MGKKSSFVVSYFRAQIALGLVRLNLKKVDASTQVGGFFASEDALDKERKLSVDGAAAAEFQGATGKTRSLTKVADVAKPYTGEQATVVEKEVASLTLREVYVKYQDTKGITKQIKPKETRRTESPAISGLSATMNELKEQEVALLRDHDKLGKELDKNYREQEKCRKQLHLLSADMNVKSSLHKNEQALAETEKLLRIDDYVILDLTRKIIFYGLSSTKIRSETEVLQELQDIFLAKDFFLKDGCEETNVVKLKLQNACLAALFRLVNRSESLLLSQINIDYLQNIFQMVALLDFEDSLADLTFSILYNIVLKERNNNLSGRSFYFSSEFEVEGNVNVKGFFEQCYALMKVIVNYLVTKYPLDDLFEITINNRTVPKTKVLDVLIVLSSFSDRYIDRELIDIVSHFVSCKSKAHWFQLLYMYTAFKRKDLFAKLEFYFSSSFCRNGEVDLCPVGEDAILNKLSKYYGANDAEIIKHFINGDDSRVVELTENHQDMIFLKLLSYFEKDSTDKILEIYQKLLIQMDGKDVLIDGCRFPYAVLWLGELVFKKMSKASKKRFKRVVESLDSIFILTGVTPVEASRLTRLSNCVSFEIKQTKQQTKQTRESVTSGLKVSEDVVEFDKSDIFARGEVTEETNIAAMERVIFEVANHVIDQFTYTHDYGRPDEEFDPNTFLVMNEKNKPLSLIDSKKRENRNPAIRQMLVDISGFRNSGDVVQEFALYKNLFEMKGLFIIGYPRVLEELIWSLINASLRGDLQLGTSERLEIVDLAWQALLLCVQHTMGRDEKFPSDIAGYQLLGGALTWLKGLDLEIEETMRFTMRCLVGSTAGHIKTAYSEVLGDQSPSKKKKLEEEARFFFCAKRKLQPSYGKPDKETYKDRNFYVSQSSFSRWTS